MLFILEDGTCYVTKDAQGNGILAKFYHRPHRPSKISILSHTDLTQTLQSSTRDPTDLHKEYLFSIWTHRDPTDLPELAY